MNDVSLIPTEDLITELLARHDHAVFASAHDISADKTHGCTDIISIRRWRGNSYTCAGLCASLVRSILNDFNDRETSIKPEDAPDVQP